MKVKLQLALIALLFLLSGNTIFGQSTINFDTDANWVAAGSLTSYFNHGYSEGVVTFTSVNTLRNTTAAQDGFPGALGTYSWRLRNAADSKVTATIASGGVSTFSISVRRWDGSPIPVYTVKYSTNATDWISLSNIDGTLLTSSDWFTYNGTINSDAANIMIELANTGTTERIMIDDFTWTGFTSGGNLPPSISLITKTPAADITSTTAVNIGATINDTDGTIFAAQVKWGTATGTYPNTIPMALAGKGVYATTSAIPAQADGTTVYFVVEATDDQSSTTTSAEQTYVVSDPATTTLPYSESFNTNLGDTYNYTVAGNKPWYFFNTSATVNGFAGLNPEEHWLVLPGMNFNNYSNEVLTFTTYAQYGTVNANNYLKLFYSTDYTGIGNVALATWTELTFTMPAGIGATEVSSPSGDVDLSAIAGTNVHLAFKYLSTDSPTRFRIDDISVQSQAVVVENPASFAATANGSDRIDLTFATNVASDNVVLVYNATGIFTDPSGVPPAVGQVFAGGTLLYNGTSSPQSHTGLSASETVYYKAFSYSGSAYSAGLTANATTEAGSGGGTNLAAGDIAIVAYACDSPDRFAFVSLVDIAAGTTIIFTDNGFNDVGALTTSENTGTYTAPAGGLTKGSVITVTDPGTGTTSTVTGGGTFEGRLSGISSSGDQVIAYQGTTDAPIFITALSTTTWLTIGTINSNSSYLPTGLINNQNAIDFPTEADNGYYSGITTGTKDALLLLINDPANWTTNNSNQVWPSWTFTVGAGGNVPPSISNVIQNPASGITPTTSVNVSADVTDTDGTISTVVLKWGLSTGNLTNTIPMVIPAKANYITSAPIPAQADGVTVYYAITATDNQAGQTTSQEYNYGVYAPATKLAFTGFPATGQQGVNLASFTVQAQRDDNSLDANYSGTITLSKATGTGNMTGTLSKAAVNGVATFNDIQFDQTGAYSLNADATALTQATSTQVNITDAPTLAEVLLPQYMQGVNGTNNLRLPFAFRVTLSNLNPSSTYRYTNQVVIATDGATTSGAGNVLFVNSNNTFTRTSSPSLSVAGGYGEFTTDANGTFTGWFMNEPSGNARFTPGNEVFMRIRLNDGNNGTAAVTFLTTTSPVKVINFGTELNANQGTAIRAESGAQAKNFMFLYDNILGNGRPLYGTSIETTGIDYAGATTWAAFYIDHVNGEDGAWGGIIPNVNASGVRLLQERKLSDGTVASSRTSSDGVWGTQTTVNPTGGTSTVIVLDLNQAPNLAVNPTTLTGFTYNEGQGPSATQSFVVNGSNLLGSVVVLPSTSFEVSLTDSPNFDAQNQINLTASGGILNNTNIYARLKSGLSAGTYSDEAVYVASNGAETQIVLLSGNVVAGITEPANHATAFAASALDFSKIQLSWADAVPAASNYLIKGSAVGYDAITAPVDGTAEANAALVRNVAAGAQTYTFEGLNALTTYYFRIFPYNGSGAEVNYKTVSPVPQASATTPSGPTMSEDILPLTMVGAPNRLPFAFRATLSGLTPNATYKYINQAVTEADGPTTSGAGNSIYVSASGVFTRTTGASFTNPAQHAEFTTDATGSYSGWFMLEPTTNARFTAGNNVFMRIRLNNGAGGTSAALYFTSQAVKVIGFGTEANENQGTAIRANSAFLPGNFAFLYGAGEAKTARPVAGTSVESTGIDFSAVTSYPSYFRDLVAGTDGAWGTIIPNTIASGVRLIEERSNASGAVVSTKTSENGSWGTTNTTNPNGGLDNVLVLDLDTRPTITVDPSAISGLDYFIGTGPSAEQSFLVSGTNLTASITVNTSTSFEISLGTGAQFVPQAQIVLAQTGGAVAPVTVYIRLKGGLPGGSYSENLQLSSTGAVAKTVVLTGNVSTPAAEPTAHLTSFQASASGMTSIQASWTDAIPAAGGYLIKGSASSYNAITAPVDGVMETEGLLVKYATAGQQTVAFTGLNPETRYYFKAFAFNGSGLAVNYKIDGTVPQDDALTQGAPGLTNLVVPKYIQGVSGTNNNRVPFAFRVQLRNLSPNTTYRYINQVVNAADGPTSAGAGNPIFVQNNDFIRSSSPSFSTAGQYGELTTDTDGYFDGWFMIEATGNSRFTPGQEVWMRIRLNDGLGGTTAAFFFTTEAVTVLNFGTTADAGSGTGIRATSGAAPKNFVFVYDNPNGSGRPLYGTSIETTGIDFASNTSYAGFYRTNVAGVIGSWGGIVPNANVLGVRRVEERSLTSGNIVDAKVSEDGFWGLTNTVNPNGGLDNVLVLDLSAGLATEKIAGQLKYFNPAETVMPTPTLHSVFYVQLMENGVAVRPRQLVKYSQTLGLDSYFEFANVEAGRTYSLKVWEQTQDNRLDNTWTWNNWGGVTALDALIVSYMTAENPIVEQLPWIAPAAVPNYSAHFFNVADANNSGNLSAVDPLVLQNRMINEPGYHPLPGGRHNFQVAGATVASHSTKKYPQAPETVFAANGVYEAGAAADQVFYEAVLPTTATGLNVFNVYFTATGDLNASFIPGPALQSGIETATTEVIKTEVGATVSIPVYATESMEVAAMSLELNYQSASIDIQSVEVDGLVNIRDGKVFISWFNQQAKTFAAGEFIALVNATVKTELTDAQPLITIGQQTEFADQLAQVINGVQLRTNAFTTSAPITGNLEISTLVYPNPFSVQAKMQITLPESGTTTVLVFNKLGQQVLNTKYVNASATMMIDLNSEALHQSGMYLYQIVHHTATRSYQSKGSFVVMQ